MNQVELELQILDKFRASFLLYAAIVLVLLTYSISISLKTAKKYLRIHIVTISLTLYIALFSDVMDIYGSMGSPSIARMPRYFIQYIFAIIGLAALTLHMQRKPKI